MKVIEININLDKDELLFIRGFMSFPTICLFNGNKYRLLEYDNWEATYQKEA